MHPKLIYPSSLLCDVIGAELPNSEIVGGADDFCTFCGKPLHGKEVFNVPYGEAFMDAPSLAVRCHRQDVKSCAACEFVMQAAFLMKNMLVVSTDDENWKRGCYSLTKDAERARFLLAPPKNGAYLAMIATSKNQHLVWRTPVSYSAKRASVRVGTITIQVRQEVLAHALDVQNKALDMARATIAAKAGKKRVSFDAKTVLVASGLRDFSVGTIPFRRDVYSASEEIRSLLDAEIGKLSHGELWALAIIGGGTNGGKTAFADLPVAPITDLPVKYSRGIKPAAKSK